MTNSAFQSLSSGSTSTSLLERVKTQDPVAWRRLVQLYGPLVHGWCKKLGPEDRADVFQEVFRAVAEHVHRFRRERPGDSFRAWLKTITRSKVNDHFRSVRKQTPGRGGSTANARLAAIPDGDFEIAPEEDQDDSAIARRALELIQVDFEPRTWEIFRHAVLEGLSTEEVAARFDTNAKAVRQAKHRVLKRLRDELSGLTDVFPDASNSLLK